MADTNISNRADKIRPMEKEDSPAVRDLLASCFSRPWSLQSLEQMFDREGYYNLLAVSEGQIIGYIGMLAVMDEADITNVAVAPPWRRQHLGDRLLAALLETAKEHGIMHIYLEVRSSNQAAIGLYKKAGFTPAGIRKAYYQNPAEDAVLMRW